MHDDLCLHSSGCGKCGKALTGRRTRWCSSRCMYAWYRNHKWRFARKECMRLARHICKGCGGVAVEVDHIKERRGAPIHQDSCLHHQANLRALCHDCHVHRYEVFDAG